MYVYSYWEICNYFIHFFRVRTENNLTLRDIKKLL